MGGKGEEGSRTANEYKIKYGLVFRVASTIMRMIAYISYFRIYENSKISKPYNLKSEKIIQINIYHHINLV